MSNTNIPEPEQGMDHGEMTPEELLELERQRNAALEAELAPFRAFKARLALSLRANVTSGNITADQMIAHADAFPPYAVGVRVEAGDILRLADERLVKVVQGHTTQADWVPGDPSTLALYTIVETQGGQPVDPDNPPADLPWQAGVEYKAGDIRTEESQRYRCLQAHTSQAGWNPSATPALWEKID